MQLELGQGGRAHVLALAVVGVVVPRAVDVAVPAGVLCGAKRTSLLQLDILLTLLMGWEKVVMVFGNFSAEQI